MPAYSADGGFTGSAKGTATKGTSAAGSTKSYNAVTKSSPTRSSAPNAAAAAASARMSSGNLGKSTPSGVGNQMGGGRTSNSGYGASRPASSSVNAAAARAGMMNDQRQAGITQTNGAAKGNFGGANQVVGKGVNLSSGDMLRGGYGQYQQASARPSGVGGLMGLQAATARMNPSVSSVVAGDPQARFGTVSSNGEIGSMMGPAGEGVFNRAMAAMLPKAPKDQSRVPSVSSPTQTAAAGYRSYDPMSSITTGNGPTPVASNPARAFPSRPTAPTQTASYDPLSSVQRPPDRPITVADVPQLPGGASTIQKGVTPSMADISQTFMNREPAAYTQQPQVASYQNPARAFPSRPTAPASAPVRSAFANELVSRGFTGGMSPATPQPASAPAPRIALSSPNPAAQRAWNIQRARDAAPPTQTVDGSLYGNAPDKPTYQKIADALTGGIGKRTVGARKLGDKINRAMGGSDYNDLYGTASQRNPNARDPNNNNSEKVRQLVAAAKAGDPTAQEQLKQWFIWNQWAPGSKPGLV